MRSSGSTPNPSPRREIALFLWVVGEDHPKACTGRRLLRRSLVRPLHPGGPSPELLLLDPHSPVPLTKVDRPRALRHGLAAVDCSWNRLAYRGAYPEGPMGAVRAEARRRLPWLLAGNPQHYGRVGELNTAEALAASLLLLGEPERGREILEGASEGASFLEVNRAFLAGYSTAESVDDTLRLERKFFGGGDV